MIIHKVTRDRCPRRIIFREDLFPGFVHGIEVTDIFQDYGDLEYVLQTQIHFFERSLQIAKCLKCLFFCIEEFIAMIVIGSAKVADINHIPLNDER